MMIKLKGRLVVERLPSGEFIEVRYVVAFDPQTGKGKVARWVGSDKTVRPLTFSAADFAAEAVVPGMIVPRKRPLPTFATG